MVTDRLKYLKIKKTGTPLSEMYNSNSDHHQNQQLFFPAEQVMMIKLLEEIRDELRKLNNR
jgi:hypothetical protein